MQPLQQALRFSTAPIVLMLSSDHDGEVVGAARAIGRALQEAGADWHALADAISFPKAAHASHLPPDDWRHMARACRMRAHRLSPREFDFINNIAMAPVRAFRKTSEKWLEAIYARCKGGRR